MKTEEMRSNSVIYTETHDGCKFQRTGEVSQNKVTSINLSSTTHARKDPQGNLAAPRCF